MQGQRQELIQQQRLTLSPQLVQSIKLMAMPFADLRERIIDEVEKNPALEVVSDPFETAMPRPPREHYTVRQGVAQGGGDEESDGHKDFIEGVLQRDATLQDYLLSQLGELSLNPAVSDLASLIIQNLDRDGFHQVPPQELPGGHDPVLLQAALETVRSLDPEGCATTDFRESLVVQAKLLRRLAPAGKKDELLETVITILEKYFSALEKGRPDALVKALARIGKPAPQLDVETAGDVFDLIRTLDPFPGRSHASDMHSYVVPDVIVNRTEDGYSVVINEEEIPVLGLSPFFMDLEGLETDKAARDFARESVKEARWFLSTLERRNLTILKLARALIVFQGDFFAHGPSHLAPLRMKDVAEEVGLHEATISRAANGKYLQCEWGLFELRYFFSNQVGSLHASASRSSSTQSSKDNPYSAGRFSKQGVKEIVREIVESSSENLSDQKIADQLALRGIHIARRTVAKYRNELTIKSSFER
ncbi:MAG TPA: RNA polymerase factor sigma-54 [Treponemataceae bacterium]|nr:RNA polymerase factor sigma-54 [Treponemataceae bacterium]